MKSGTNGLILGITTIMGIFFLLFCLSFNWGLIFGYGCYQDKAILHNQRVGKLEGCCENCLIFYVTEFVCRGDKCGCDWEKRTLYFADEKQIRTDLKNESEIVINWCWVKQIKDYEGICEYSISEIEDNLDYDDLE